MKDVFAARRLEPAAIGDLTQGAAGFPTGKALWFRYGSFNSKDGGAFSFLVGINRDGLRDSWTDVMVPALS